MKQPLEFQQNEIEEVAKNAEALFSWLEQEEPVVEERVGRVKIPAQLILVTATALASGLPILLDMQGPGSACWVGGCLIT